MFVCVHFRRHVFLVFLSLVVFAAGAFSVPVHNSHRCVAYVNVQGILIIRAAPKQFCCVFANKVLLFRFPVRPSPSFTHTDTLSSLFCLPCCSLQFPIHYFLSSSSSILHEKCLLHSHVGICMEFGSLDKGLSNKVSIYCMTKRKYVPKETRRNS